MGATEASDDETPDPAVMDLFRELARASGDTLVLADGPPHPDVKLLELVNDALDAHRRARVAWAEYREAWDMSPSPAGRKAASDPAYDRYKAEKARVARLTKAAGKIPAQTPVGLFAKCQLVRLLITARTGIAGSVARDIMSNPTIRATLWPAPGADGARQD